MARGPDKVYDVIIVSSCCFGGILVFDKDVSAEQAAIFGKAGHMAGLSYELGRKVGGIFRKGKWVARSLAGDKSISDRAEFEMGRDMARQFAKDIDRDPAANRLVTEVGGRLVDRLINHKMRFNFRVLSPAQANAFALPGGFVFVTAKLLEVCQYDRDEVAFVLGHEIGHVARRHAIRRLMDKAAIDFAARAIPGRGLLNQIAKHAGTKLLQSAYSQDQEFEADDFGYRLTASAGFDGRAALRTFQRLQKIKDLPDSSEVLTYFSSHPPFDLRTEKLKRYM